MAAEIQEAFKSLRTNIQFCGADKQVILLTSCISGEGKSSTCMHLAMSLAELEKRVVLVDADLRKSVLLGKLIRNREEIVGLTHFLTGQATMDEIVYETDVENFHLICSGPYSPNPSEILSSNLFEELIETLRRSYDFVIVDTAPLGTVIDAAVVARVCDGAVLVVEAGKINYHFEQEMKEQMEKSGCPILGAILNKVDVKKAGYGYGKYGKYSKYGYGGYYGYGYGYESEGGSEGGSSHHTSSRSSH